MPADLWACLPSGPPPCLPANPVACLPAAPPSPHDHGEDAVRKNGGQTGRLAWPHAACPGQTVLFYRARGILGLAASLFLHAIFLSALLGLSFQAVQNAPGNAIAVSLMRLGAAPVPATGTTGLPADAPPPLAAPVQPEPAAAERQPAAPPPTADTRPKTVSPQKTALASAGTNKRTTPPSAPEKHQSATPPAATPVQASTGGAAADAPASSATDAATAADADKVYSPRQLDQSPAVTKGVRPEYPPSARSRKVEGRVIVRMVVETSGQPGQCSIHSATPQGYFEEAALDAARRMRFRPGTKAGKAVRTLVLLPFDFSLR